MSNFDLSRTRATPRELGAALRSSYATSLRCVGDLDAEFRIGPYLPIVNPPHWEIGHVGWFTERWVLRRPTGAESFLPDADALYDSMRVPHAARWSLPLPSWDHTLAYFSRVTNAVLQKLDTGAIAEPEELYYVELALHHQDMHNEAFRYTRQTHRLSNPLGTGIDPAVDAGANEDVSIPSGRMLLGSTREDGWVFDNEKWAHEVEVGGFRIGRLATSNRDYLGFVEDGGYARRELWSEGGWRWASERGLHHPVYWRRAGAGWEQRVYDRWIALRHDWPVMHVSCHEAEAWCRWAGRRLPTEREWERAAASVPGLALKRRYPWGQDAEPGRANLPGIYLASVGSFAGGDSAWGVRQMAGNVWEWTATVFEPYPGFRPDPYEDYSRPWFGTHRVLRGGGFATEARIARCAYRNFYTPDRADVFAGFRSCAA